MASISESHRGGRRDAVGGFLSLRRRAVSPALAPPLSVQPLLLLDLPQGAGGGGFAINLGGEHDTLEVTGREHVRVYHAWMRDGDETEPYRSPAERHFCGSCGSHLWLWDPRWPELVHPLASTIDTPLPVPPERTHLMLGSKASWVEPAIGPRDQQFDAYPEESIAAWHERLGLVRDS